LAQRPTLIIIGASSRDSVELLEVLSPLADVVGVERNLSEGLDEVSRHNPDLLLLMLRAGEEEGFFALAREVPFRSAGTVQIILAPKKDPDLILAALRAGVREFVCTDEGWEPLRRVIRALAAERGASKPGEEARGRLVTVFGAAGGSGQTTVAVNLAGSLSQDGARPVLLLDLDLQLGAASVFLDLEVRYTISDVLENLKRLDRQLLLGSLPRHRSGIYLLAQGDFIEQADEIKGEQITELIGFLRRHFEFIVVDGVRGFGEHSIAALDPADAILLLVTQDIPTLKNARRCLDLFSRLAYEPTKSKLIVNRYLKRHKISLEAIEENLHHPVAEVVGNDYETVSGAINRGVLVGSAAPSAKVTADLERLAPLVGGVLPKPPEGGGILSSILGIGRRKAEAPGKKGFEPA
jgi:pilus assembly protein CpaE